LEDFSMKPKSLKALIKQVRGGLRWPVLEQPHDLPVLRIVSYPRTKSHAILVPETRPWRSTDLDYLHELGHATLCEQVHPVFSASCHFASQDSERHFLLVVPALNAACDWFICHRLSELSPQVSCKQIQNGLSVAEEVLSAAQLPPLEIILDAAGVVAQGIHFLDEPIECEGVLRTAVDAFLAVPPEQPSAENCLHLVNLLMGTYTDFRARLLQEGELFSWEVYGPDAGARQEGSP
jgi:hypothetical protein